ncbi:MAG: leucine-rich repeat domain-containing protein [Lachnospiraceae bacterium]|nr:leucine-rich repeat domain-containing protein [Lachnospiraceae bacterium]
MLELKCGKAFVAEKMLMAGALAVAFILSSSIKAQAENKVIESNEKWEPADTVEVDNLTVNEKGTISLKNAHLIVNGNLIAKGKIDLQDGSVLEVKGDYRHEDGELDIASDSELDVDGDLLFRKLKADDTYTTSTASFYARKESVTRVGKYFCWDSTGNDLNIKGNLYIGGNINVKSDDTVLQGDVYLESNEPATIELGEKARIYSLYSKSPEINVVKYINVNNFQNDVVLKNAEGKIYSTTYFMANGHAVTVNGALIANGEVTTGDGGKITVNGDMQCLSGSVDVASSAQLDVKGKLLFEKQNAAGDITSVSASFYPRKNSIVKVGEDFVWNSTGNDLNLNGDLHISGNINVKSDDTVLQGNVYLESNEPATIDIGEKARIYSLYSKSPEINVVKYINVNKFQNDVVLKNVDGKMYTTTYFIANGHAVTVNGALIANGEVTTGDGGKLSVMGDMQCLQGEMNVTSSSALNVEGSLIFEKYGSAGDASTVSAAFYPQRNSVTTVKNDFIWNSTGNALNLRGELDVYGNYLDKRGINWNGTVKLLSKGQKVTVANSGKINKLVLAYAKSDYTFEPNPCWTELIESGGNTSLYVNAKVSSKILKAQKGNETIPENSSFTITAVSSDGKAPGMVAFDGVEVENAEVVTIPKTIYIDGVPYKVTTVSPKAFEKSAENAGYKVTDNRVDSLAVEYAGQVNAKKTKKTVSVPEYSNYRGIRFKVTGIAAKSFRKNTKVTKVKIASSITMIGANCFEGCTKLQQVTVGKGLKEIGKNAFKNCKKLTLIQLKGTKLKKVGKSALKGVNAKCKIKVPKARVKAYAKLFKGKGQKKSVKVVKG